MCEVPFECVGNPLAELGVKLLGRRLVLSKLPVTDEVMRETSKWDKVCDEYLKLFGKPGSPPARHIKHEIN